MNGVRFAASSVEQFARLTAPDGPYTSLSLGARLTDGIDGIALSGLNMNAATSGDCSGAGDFNAASLGAATEINYGRLEVQNSFVAETSPLEASVRNTVFDGSNFVVNGADTCTTYQSSGAVVSNYQDGLPTVTVLSPSTAPSLVNGISAAGRGIFLSSPGATNTGSVDLTYDAPSWLEFDWSGTGLRDPFGTAIFPTFRGHDKVVHWHEVF